MYEQSTKYSQKDMESAISQIRSFDADHGGTDILNPLKFITGQPADLNYPRHVFLLTDGQVSNSYEV